MTIATAKSIARTHGFSLNKTAHGEFRVNRLGGNESTACYESDVDAALDTVLAEAQGDVTEYLVRVGLRDSYEVR